MSATYLYERGAAHIYERDIARRWYALAPGTRLPLSDGASCVLHFAGLPGSSAGPDVQDAILAFPEQRTGAVEFHVYSSDWYAHRHHQDARYNSVILHVVLVCANADPALRQDGTSIPACSLNDLGSASSNNEQASWPCQHITSRMNGAEQERLLRQAGLLRFEQKAHAFVEQLHTGQASALFSAHDTCLILALAEALGYGRDRAIFHAAGARLLGLSVSLPEPLGHTAQPSRLDAGRLASLRELVDAWQIKGAWNMIRDTLTACMDCERVRELFVQAGISESRADILICNVVLPFAYAIGLIEHDQGLCESAQSLYLTYPALPSNRVTRAMTRQLRLAAEPPGACRQQGLHYIYQQSCQEKRCEQCIAGRWSL